MVSVWLAEFDGDPDRDADPGIFDGIFTTAGVGQLQKFCKSAASGGGLPCPSASSLKLLL